MSSPCLLCGSDVPAVAAGFRQIYPQSNGSSALLDWWECSNCGGWYVDPPPTPLMIAQYWQTVPYASPDCEDNYANQKEAIFKRLLEGIARRGRIGGLLDVGCNSGIFMQRAKEAGWNVAGYDPNLPLVEVARNRGLDVRHAWCLDDSGLAQQQYEAITAIDVFYYSWNPIRDLKAFYRCLCPGGTLAMRLTNKRLVLGLMRFFSPAGEQRDRKLSKLLQGQFHSVSARSLCRILKSIGYEDVKVVPGAATIPFRQMRWRSRLAYLASDVVYYGSLHTLNISPGILLFASKPIQPRSTSAT
jgi:SAM-dependent methyltransferase